MTYSFHFGDIWAAREQLFWGTLLTLELLAGSMVLRLVVAVFGVLARTGHRAGRQRTPGRRRWTRSRAAARSTSAC